MNTQLRIKTRRLLFSPNVLTLLVFVGLVLVLGSPSTQAQTADTAAGATASTGTVDSSITVATKGSVSDPNGTITVSGNVIISCRRVLDTTTTTTAAAAPVVLLDFDFSQLKGTSGNGKTLKTYVTGDNHATEIRPLQSSDTIIVTAPYFDSAKGELSARSMLVTATLSFDVTSGKLTGGSITLGNNVVTTATVGSFTVN